MYFALEKHDAASVRRFLKALDQTQLIADAYELGSEYQFGISVLVRAPEDLTDLLASLTTKTGVTIAHKDIALRTEYTIFDRKYLVPPHVICLIRCVGNWDYEAIVEVGNAADLPQVYQDLFTALGERVASIRSVPLFRYLKLTCFPFSRPAK